MVKKPTVDIQKQCLGRAETTAVQFRGRDASQDPNVKRTKHNRLYTRERAPHGTAVAEDN